MYVSFSLAIGVGEGGVVEVDGEGVFWDVDTGGVGGNSISLGGIL